MLLRLMVILVLAALVYGWLRSNQRHNRDARNALSQPPLAEDMVRCAQCGIHLPRSEGILSAQKTFCCVEHRDAYAR